jgi:hypothetical protein
MSISRHDGEMLNTSTCPLPRYPICWVMRSRQLSTAPFAAGPACRQRNGGSRHANTSLSPLFYRRAPIHLLLGVSLVEALDVLSATAAPLLHTAGKSRHIHRETADRSALTPV